MPAYRSIRIQMPDRPGALSTISAALAAHGVDIVRLDVVSHEGSMVVDDLLLGAAAQEEIGAAIGGFYPEVTVRTFESLVGDPALEMGNSLGRIAAAGSIDGARSEAISGAARIGRADDALLLRVRDDGGFAVVAGAATVPAVAPSEAFAGRWVLERRAAAAFPVADGWAPLGFQHALGSAWVALAPVGAFDLLLTSRALNIPYYAGELERIASYGEAAGAILASLGDRPHFSTIPTFANADLPQRAVCLARRIPTV